MRFYTFNSRDITLLLLVVASAQAGLVHRKYRNENLSTATKAKATATATADNLIPVQIIQDDVEKLVDSAKAEEQANLEKVIKPEEPKSTLLTGEILPSSTDKKGEKITDNSVNIPVVSAALDNERQEDEQIVDQDNEKGITEKNKEIVKTSAIAEQALKGSKQSEPQSVQQAQEINIALKMMQSTNAEESPAIYFSAPEIKTAEFDKAAEIKNSAFQFKSSSLIADNMSAESQGTKADTAASTSAVAPAVELLAVNADEKATIDNAPAPAVAIDQQASSDLVRQATPATPTKTSTQQNFVQQLIQNSPIGQFLGQFAGGQQPQQEQQGGGPIAADQPATPAPTLPGFLNPQNALTQVQNAAQSVANATAQAFQGVQQFATNLGTQFQNTLSSLGGQQQNQLSNTDSTSPRPPGPIQSFITTFVGGSQPAATAADVSATTNPDQQQQHQQTPLQGIISFLQGGGNNRPQIAVVASGSPGNGGSAAVVAPAPTPGPTPAPVNIEPQQLDNKVDKVQKVEQTNEITDAVAQEHEAETDQIDNEVRNSEEVGTAADSFEDNIAGASDQLIIVNDDSGQVEDVNDEVGV